VKPSKEFRELLTRKKLKKTSQRDMIWNLLIHAKGHPSVEELREALIAKGQHVGIATVYRTLKILLAAGMIRQSKLAGTTRYEAVVQEPNHLHFICNNCQKTVEFPSARIESLIRKVTAENRFEERYSRYMIFGVCKACQKKEERSAGISERMRLEKTAVRDALELTLAIERLGYAFYTNASKRTRNDRGRLMFQRLAAEESEHLRKLQEEHRKLLSEHSWLKREPARLPVSRRMARDLFPLGDLMRFQVTEQTSDLEALNIAMDLERRSHDFFKLFAKQLDDPTGRKAFLDFAREEEGHLNELRAEYDSVGRKD